ncbi:hypothetical protein PB2503_11264 [Parvularcula bermudensis HTCC2503]|uniref:Methyltransferase FkbM domain-containing protein n=1 Tax=Parvularcula bermudensis (strain ATCC BAA-594 / HTCC2503 / KCTC 12087) TaxID=314260 RepID=E0TC42_PARBH|nr:FkbM family methyltransferase [Parvularcula bermudensis]ADM10300.1 hypothetical protein PB2503_11264 [Parvularcula bermudensis HTCC2503]
MLSPKRLATKILDRTKLNMWAKLHHGPHLRVDMSNTVGRSIYLRHRYEPSIEQVVREMLTLGDTFLDIGANVGYFSAVAAGCVGPTGRVIAVEPNIALCKNIRDSISRNGWSNIEVLPMGVGANASFDVLRVQPSSGVSYVGTVEEAEDQAISVELIVVETIDSILAKLALDRPPKLIKIDVEGRERDALQGATALLGQRSTSFIVEHAARNQARFGVGEHEVAEIFRQFGYEPTAIGQSAIDWSRSDVLWQPAAH